MKPERSPALFLPAGKKVLSEQSVSVLALRGKGSHPCCCSEPVTVLAHTQTCTHARAHGSGQRAGRGSPGARHPRDPRGLRRALPGARRLPVLPRSGSWDDGDGALR